MPDKEQLPDPYDFGGDPAGWSVEDLKIEKERQQAREIAKQALLSLGYDWKNLEPDQKLEVKSIDALQLAFNAGIEAHYGNPGYTQGK